MSLTKTMDTVMGHNKEVSRTSGGASGRDVQFWLALLYVLTFYVQPGGRIRVLGLIRFELLLGGTLVLLLILTRAHRVITGEKINRAALVFFAAIGLSFIGALMTHTVSDAIPVFIGLVKLFCIYLMILGTVDSEDKLEKYIWIYLFAMLIIVGEPFLLSLQGKNFRVGEDGVVRLYGVGQFEHPNGFGTLTATNLPFLYYLFFYYRSRLVKGFLLGYALISLRVIMLTGSRTAYVGLLAVVMCLWIFSEHKLKFIAVAALLAVLAIPFIPDMYKERFLSMKQVTEVVTADERVPTSIGGRWHLIKTGWKVFLDYPIFGCGLDSFRHAAQKYGVYAQSHNLLIQILTNTGLVGLSAFSYLIYTTFRVLRETRRNLIELGRTTTFMYCLNGAVSVFLLAELTTGLLAQHILVSNCWWIAAGAALVSARIVSETSATVEQEPRRPTRKARPARPRPVRAAWNLAPRSHE